MKTILSFIVCLLFAVSNIEAAGPVHIYDEYYGHGLDQPDVNGSKEIYDINRMSVFIHPDGSLSITILSNYLHTVGVNNLLTDVFISVGWWKPNAEKDHFETDNYETGEIWEYVISIVPEHRQLKNGKLFMYSLNKSYEVDANETRLTYSTGVVLLNDKQETIYIPNKDEKNVGVGNFFIGGLDTKETGDDFISIYVDTNEFKCKPLAVHYSGDMGAHDIIEGDVPNRCDKKPVYKKPYFKQHKIIRIDGSPAPLIPEEPEESLEDPDNPDTPPAPVPEPATIFLMGIGLAGIAASKKYLNKK